MEWKKRLMFRADDDYREHLQKRVLEPDLCVRSGVYTAIDSSLRMRLGSRGEYEHIGLDENYAGPAEELLKVSAFGDPEFDEDEYAQVAFPISDGAFSHPVIGHYRGLYAGYVVEADYREIGSSGGFGSWLLIELLRTGKIDGVIHMVPTPGEGALFAYRLSHTENEIRQGAKTRYYPGQLGDVLTEIKSLGGRYALTAIPSFAYEVRLLQQQRPEYKAQIPFIIGLVCGHQKTANYALNLAWQLGVPASEIETVDFRRKVVSEPSNRYTTEVFTRKNGELTSRVARQEQLLGTDWGLGMFKSNFSDFTEDALNETADIVLGDAWLPKYTPDGRGTSIVITRNADLHLMLSKAQGEGRIHLESLDEDEVLRSQSGVVRQNYEELPARFSYIARKGGYVPSRRRRHDQQRVSFARRLVQIRRHEASQATPEAWEHAVSRDDYDVFRAETFPLVRRYRWAQRLANAKHLPKRVVRKALRLLKR